MKRFKVTAVKKSTGNFIATRIYQVPSKKEARRYAQASFREQVGAGNYKITKVEEI